MRYYKTCSEGYLIAIGSGGKQGETISEYECEEIKSALNHMPEKDGYCYRLKTDLSYEAFEAEKMTIKPDDSEYAEAGKILLGVSE